MSRLTSRGTTQRGLNPNYRSRQAPSSLTRQVFDRYLLTQLRRVMVLERAAEVAEHIIWVSRVTTGIEANLEQSIPNASFGMVNREALTPWRM